MSTDRLLDTAWSAGGRLRGLIWRPLLEGCGDGLRVDSGVKIRHPSKIRMALNVWLKEGVLLDGRSDNNIGIHLGENVTVRAYSYIDSYGGAGYVNIGARTGIGQYVYIGGNGGVDIGEDVMISGHTFIVAANHIFNPSIDKPYRAQGETREGIRIEENAWVAARSVILDGVSIGRGAVVGAGSIVTRDVAPYTLVAGCPARVIRPLIDLDEGSSTQSDPTNRAREPRPNN